MKKFLLVFIFLLTFLSFVSCETQGTNNKKDIITLGKYPQKEIIDASIINELKLLSPNELDRLEYNSNEYICVDGKYYELAPIEWEKIKILT